MGIAFKRIFGGIWAIWAYAVMFLSLLFVFPLYMSLLWFGKKGETKALLLSRAWAKFLLSALLIKIKVSGLENYKPSGVYVMVSNHRSHLDIPITAAAAIFPFKFLAKEELTKIPILGIIINKLYITVCRHKRDARALSMLKMKECLDKGISVGIFPEGTRNKGPELLKDFYDGAFKLAIENKIPIAPLSVVGSAEILHPKTKLYLLPGTVHCIWNPPVAVDGLKQSDAGLLKEKVKGEMLQNLKVHFPQGTYPAN